MSNPIQQQDDDTVDTRTFHRNSILAFPKTAEYGCAITRTTRRISWVRVVLIFMFLMAGAYLFQ